MPQITSKNIAKLNDTSIIAGHFPWDIWNKLPNFSNLNFDEEIISSKLLKPIKNNLNHNFNTSLNQEIKSNPPPVDCFVMGRHPVDRSKLMMHV